MVHDAWISALGTGSRDLLPFAAAQRKHERTMQPPLIWHTQIRYRQWDGPIGPWAEHFGKAGGQVYPLNGGEPIRSCNEVEVAKLLRAVRSEAFWISPYNPNLIPEFWRPWVLAPAEMPDWLSDLDSCIRRRISAKSGGIPDVVAWDPNQGQETALFVECKGPKEKIKEDQEDWVAAAIEEGMSPTQFAVAIRVFS